MSKRAKTLSPGTAPPAARSSIRTQPGRPWRSRAIASCLAIASAALALAAPIDTLAIDVCTGPAVALPQLCSSPVAGPSLSCAVPEDAQSLPPGTPLYAFQRAANVFSWQAFIALNWPARLMDRGEPDVSMKLGDPGAAVWETYREPFEVFRTAGTYGIESPLPWDFGSFVPPGCTATDRVLHRTTKIEDVLTDTLQPTGRNALVAPTLTDRYGGVTRYEIRLNRTAYNAILLNRWWDADAQAKRDEIRFPDGSMIVKAAWVPVAAADEPRFRTVDACVCDDRKHISCKRQRMGLVGWHLMSKTPSAPQWLWSTFEQVDNVPGTCRAPVAANHASNAQPSPQPTQQATYWSQRNAHASVNQQTKAGTPNQICRVIPISASNPVCGDTADATDNVAALNRAVRARLEGTPFANYQLVDTQWPAPAAPNARPRAHTELSVLPKLLGNTTLESFIQDTSSCMGCHAMARTVRNAPASNPDAAAFVSADFTFMLGTASPRQFPPPMLRELDIRHECGRSLDDDIRTGDWKCVGSRVANRTYESNGLERFVGAKLHCASCHLDTGRNPRASWWHGMLAKYATPDNLKAGGLAGRINHCFANSLNGKPLCKPDANGHCPDNPYMTGLIAYMEWLTHPAQNPEEIAIDPKRPAFPVVDKGAGASRDGRRIFEQKCAFCHGADGQGRYDGNVYFRPALWGPKSFNTAAGMDAYNALASFVYGNMPLGSGGALTKQEARDLACFIDRQRRPIPAKGGKPSPVSPSGIQCDSPRAKAARR